MALSPAPNVAQVELMFNWQGEICQNVLHYYRAGDWDEATLFDLADSIAAQWATDFPAVTSNTVTLYNIVATALYDNNGPQVVYDGILPTPGTRVSPSMPNNVSCVFTKRTAFRGRSYRGRIYFIGLTEDAIAANQVTAGVVNGITTGFTNLMTFTIDAVPATLSVLSRIQNGVQINPAQSILVTAITSDGVVDSQRRRLPGRGS